MSLLDWYEKGLALWEGLYQGPLLRRWGKGQGLCLFCTLSAHTTFGTE